MVTEQSRSRRAAALAVCLAALILAACQSSSAPLSATTTSSHSATTVSPTTSGPAPARNVVPTTISLGQSTPVAVPVVVCPTGYGSSPPPTANLASAITETIPEALVGKVAIYVDAGGVMKLLGPSNWSCVGGYGADGVGGIWLYPPGASAPSVIEAMQACESDVPGCNLWASNYQAFIGHETSACLFCALSQACELFSAAANANNIAYPQAPCPPKPAGETSTVLGATEVEFVDPPGVKGNGVPSGGDYLATGVMTYVPHSPAGSWMETCTVPAALEVVCNASLNLFALSYYQE